jgi:hypothetical protein
MTEGEIMDHLTTTLKANNSDLTALGFINEDVSDVGFESWLEMAPSTVAACFYEVTQEVAGKMVEDYGMMVSQEDVLDDLGIDQTMRLDPVDCMNGLKNGMLEIFCAMETYYESQEFAREHYGKHE